MAMVITVERFPSTKQKLAVGFTEQGLATMEKVGARGSHGFPWGHRRNESTGVTPEEHKYTGAHGKNIAFGDVPLSRGITMLLPSMTQRQNSYTFMKNANQLSVLSPSPIAPSSTHPLLSDSLECSLTGSSVSKPM